MTEPLEDAPVEQAQGKGGKKGAKEAGPEDEDKAAAKEKKRLAREANAAKKGGKKPAAAEETKTEVVRVASCELRAASFVLPL